MKCNCYGNRELFKFETISVFRWRERLLTPKHLIYGTGINARKNSDWYDVVELKKWQNETKLKVIIQHYYMLALQVLHSHQRWKSNNTYILKESNTAKWRKKLNNKWIKHPIKVKWIIHWWEYLLTYWIQKSIMVSQCRRFVLFLH